MAATVLMLLHVMFAFFDMVGMSFLFLFVTVGDTVEKGWDASIWNALNGSDIPLQEPEDAEQEA